jgi:very-short-patch-repair endonuclease
MRGANEQTTERARALRALSTNAEAKLWNRLRARMLGGHKFARQVPIGRFVADFICREQRLIIEADGGQHADNPNDTMRDEWLRRHRYRVLRFWNHDVLTNTDGFLEAIAAALDQTPPHPDR